MAVLQLASSRVDANPAHHPAPAAAPAAGAMGAAPVAPTMGAAPEAPSMAAAPEAPSMGAAPQAPPMGAAPVASATGSAAAPSAMGSAAAAPGMGGMMSGGCMGAGCGGGAGATPPLYPALMTLPSLTPEHRAEIAALASQQTDEGMARLARGSEALGLATHAGDDASLQEAIVTMRGGLAEVESGVSARQVLAAGKAPRNLALSWFKREMNLAATAGPRQPVGARGGVRVLHVFTMALLVAFAAAMVAMYFFKMRRAASLFRRLEGDRGAPPPGSAPPLAGAPAPAPAPAPADGGKPPVDVAKPKPDPS